MDTIERVVSVLIVYGFGESFMTLMYLLILIALIPLMTLYSVIFTYLCTGSLLVGKK